MVAQVFPASIPPHVESGGLDVKWKNREARFGDGYIQVAGDGINSKKDTWNLKWANEDTADVETIKTFLNDHAGFKPFLWTPPGGVEGLWYNPGGYVESNLRVLSSTLTAAFLKWFGSDPV